MHSKNVAECVTCATACEYELRYKVYGFFPHAFAGTLKMMLRTGIDRVRAALPLAGEGWGGEMVRTISRLPPDPALHPQAGEASSR